MKNARSGVRVWRWLSIVGPGVLVALAGDDAGGLAMTSAIGAQWF